VCGGCPAEWSAWGMAEGGALVLLELPFDWLDRCRLLQAKYGVAKVVGEKRKRGGAVWEVYNPAAAAFGRSRPRRGAPTEQSHPKIPVDDAEAFAGEPSRVTGSR